MDFIVPFDRINIAGLAAAMNTSVEKLNVVASATGANVESVYIRHQIPKRNRASGRRVVHEPKDDDVKLSQQALAIRLHDFVARKGVGYPHSAVHGFLPRRNIVTNAAAHLMSPQLLRLDIRGFFPSITVAQIASTLAEFGISTEVSTLIAQACTIDGVLAEGLPSSPCLANLVCLKMDARLATVASELGLVYTRYADDIAFSGPQLAPIHRIAEVLAAYGFTIATAKTRRSKPGQAHFVTGLAVSAPGHPRVPKHVKRRVRQELYYAAKFGLEHHAEKVTDGDVGRAINSIAGRISFITGVERERGRALRHEFKAILDAAGMPLGAGTVSRRTVPTPLTINIDEGEMPDGRLSLSAIALEERELPRVDAALREVLEALKTDPFAAGRRAALDRHGLHFTDNHPEARAKVVEVMAVLPFRAYVNFSARGPENYTSKYTQLAVALLGPRLLRHYQRRITLVFEQNSQINRGVLQEIVNQASLYVLSGRRRLSYPVAFHIGQKSTHPSLAIADYILGAINAHASSPDDIHLKRLERLRPRIRLIADVDKSTFYTRRRPFSREVWGAEAAPRPLAAAAPAAAQE